MKYFILFFFTLSTAAYSMEQQHHTPTKHRTPSLLRQSPKKRGHAPVSSPVVILKPRNPQAEPICSFLHEGILYGTSLCFLPGDQIINHTKEFTTIYVIVNGNGELKPVSRFNHTNGKLQLAENAAELPLNAIFKGFSKK